MENFVNAVKDIASIEQLIAFIVLVVSYFIFRRMLRTKHEVKRGNKKKGTYYEETKEGSHRPLSSNHAYKFYMSIVVLIGTIALLYFTYSVINSYFEYSSGKEKIESLEKKN